MDQVTPATQRFKRGDRINKDYWSTFEKRDEDEELQDNILDCIRHAHETRVR